MQRINETFGQSFAEIYQQIQQEIDNELEVEYIYNNNRLEGSYFTKWAVEKISKGIPIRKKNRFKANDILAAQQQFKAIKFVRDMASILNYNISEADIKHIHFMISEYLVANPGQYRTNDIDVTVPPSEIPKHMNELINFINNKGGAFYKFRPIERAACIHHRFMKISPFKDFNGSVARLLMNFVLIKEGIPLTVIRVNDRQEYLDSLNKEDSIYFSQFVIKCVLNTVNAYSVRMKEYLISDNLCAQAATTQVMAMKFDECIQCNGIIRGLTDAPAEGSSNGPTAKHLRELHEQNKLLLKRLKSITVFLRKH